MKKKDYLLEVLVQMVDRSELLVQNALNKKRIEKLEAQNKKMKPIYNLVVKSMSSFSPYTSLTCAMAKYLKKIKKLPSELDK